MERRWKQIGDLIESFVTHEGLTWERFYDVSGVSEATVSKIRKGEPIVRRDKRAEICRVLGWTGDSIDRILRGEEPVAVTRPIARREGQSVLESQRLRRDLDALTDRIDRALELCETNAVVIEELQHRVAELESRRSVRGGRRGSSNGT